MVTGQWPQGQGSSVTNLEATNVVLHLALVEFIDEVGLVSVLPLLLQCVKHDATQFLHVMLLPRCTHTYERTHTHACYKQTHYLFCLINTANENKQAILLLLSLCKACIWEFQSIKAMMSRNFYGTALHCAVCFLVTMTSIHARGRTVLTKLIVLQLTAPCIDMAVTLLKMEICWH